MAVKCCSEILNEKLGEIMFCPEVINIISEKLDKFELNDKLTCGLSSNFEFISRLEIDESKM